MFLHGVLPPRSEEIQQELEKRYPGTIATSTIFSFELKTYRERIWEPKFGNTGEDSV
jgi:hypothetical protein